MLKYVTKTEYKNLLGSSIPSNFDYLVIDASNYINSKTHWRIEENNPSEQVKYVTCLIINLLEEENTKLSEISNLKSENIEGWSKTYATPEEVKKDYSDKKYEILKQYLIYEIGTDGLPLLYCGVV